MRVRVKGKMLALLCFFHQLHHARGAEIDLALTEPAGANCLFNLMVVIRADIRHLQIESR